MVGNMGLPRQAGQWHSVRKAGEPEQAAAANFAPSAALFQSRYQQPMTAEEAYNCGVVQGQPGGWFGSGGGSTATPPPPPGAPPPPAGSQPWYQPIKDCWNKLFHKGDTGGISTWDARSDHAFDAFISPVTNPAYFEDPRSLTEWRPIFMYQKSPGDNPLMTGGNIFVFNLQGRISINDRWSLILHRLGVANVNPGEGALGGFDGGTGLTDLQVGTKYTFYRDDRTNTLAALGVSFEIPIGSSSVLSGTGAGATPYLSYGQGFGNWHLLATTGYRIGFSSSTSDFFFLSGHLDYSFYNRFYPLVEMNWYHYTSAGDERAVDFEGADLFNLGADGAAGTNIVTIAPGFRFKFSEGLQTGVVVEFPLTGTSALEQYRIIFDLIFRY
jgi:hypothetical protein